MTHTEMRALKLSDISQTPTKFYPQLIKAASGLFNGVEDYLFFQTYPLALIRINKPTYAFSKNHNLNFAVLFVTCEEEGLAKKITEEITEKIRPLFKEIYDQPVNYLKTLPGFTNANGVISRLKDISNKEFRSYKTDPEKFNGVVRIGALIENAQQN